MMPPLDARYVFLLLARYAFYAHFAEALML